ncbi:hypothetical protein GCM10010994_59820 [Chelatococcus reniformis]|uniref:Conjugal transfer protein TrbK n=2 Tax=Chelatococcus reniformis TaxID=1494448 RepID=A0A916UY39_9HYPH|nr:hypothetical protein GCM10010994_59820 [Chelatococcus reniformis]
MFARLGAAVFVVIAMAATALEFGERTDVPPGRSADGSKMTRDARRGELERCQLLGEAATRDAACLRAWADNRKRFLGGSRTASCPLPDRASAAADGPTCRRAAPPDSATSLTPLPPSLEPR